LPHSLTYIIRTKRRSKTLVQVAQLLTRQMFHLDERGKQDHRCQIVSQVQSIQRQVFRQIRPRFVARHGQMEGSRLAQVTVDRLFGRSISLKGDDSRLASQFAAEVASEDQFIRNAAFISLLAMLEVERANKNAASRRRIAETISWLEQFGEVPADASEPDALAGITEALG
jgi:hypothetical protein